jgi:dephospho-CoA kinase
MIIVGLVGGVACGKSFVAQNFQNLGAAVLDGDRVGHEVLNLPVVRLKLAQRWGEEVLTDGGGVNRPAVAEIVFGSGEESRRELEFLESCTHPEIERVLADRLRRMEKLGRFPVAVLDAAVMLKAGWDKLCDHVIFVEVPRPLRLKRALLRGLSEADFVAREAAQLPLEQKRARADIVIDNSGTPADVLGEVQKVWRLLVKIA